MARPRRRNHRWIGLELSAELMAALDGLALAFERDPNLALARFPIFESASDLSGPRQPGARLACEPIDPFSPCGAPAEAWAREQPASVLKSLCLASVSRPEPGSCFAESVARQTLCDSAFALWQAAVLERSLPQAPAPRPISL